MVTPINGELGAQLAEASERVQQEQAQQPQAEAPPRRPHRATGKPPGRPPGSKNGQSTYSPTGAAPPPPGAGPGPGPSSGSSSGSGRKRGANFKAKVTLPPDVLFGIALAPLGIVSMGMGWLAKLPQDPPPSEKTQQNVVAAFQAWLDTLDFELTPADALLFFYGMGLVEMTAVTMAHLRVRAAEAAAKRDAETAAQKSAAEQREAAAPPTAVPTTPEPEAPGPDAKAG